MVDRWNATNTSYRTLTNLTFTGDVLFNITGLNNDLNIINSTSNASLLFINGTFGRVGIGTITPKQTLNVFGDANATGTVYSEGINNLTIAFLYNSTGLIRNWNISGDIQNWNTTGYLRSYSASDWNSSGLIQNWNTTGYLRDWSGVGGNSSWNQTYASGELYFLKSQWNVTNATYAVNQTLTDMWTAFLDETNSSYLMIDRFNVTNKTYRTLDNVTFPGLFVNASHIANSVINASHILVAGINASHIAVGSINSTHASAEFNNSYRGLRNGTFTQGMNMTTFNITFSGTVTNITSNTTCISIWGPTAILEIC